MDLSAPEEHWSARKSTNQHTPARFSVYIAPKGRMHAKTQGGGGGGYKLQTI